MPTAQDSYKSIAFTEVCMFIQDSNDVYRLADLFEIYQTKLKAKTESLFNTNKTRFKKHILEIIPELTERQSCRETLFSCEEDVSGALNGNNEEKR